MGMKTGLPQNKNNDYGRLKTGGNKITQGVPQFIYIFILRTVMVRARSSIRTVAIILK
jgi:hypothetical protein